MTTYFWLNNILTITHKDDQDYGFDYELSDYSDNDVDGDSREYLPGCLMVDGRSWLVVIPFMVISLFCSLIE